VIEVVIEASDMPPSAGRPKTYFVLIRGLPAKTTAVLGQARTIAAAQRLQAKAIAELTAYTGPHLPTGDKDLWDHLSEDDDPV
jgi:hypothetical protein